MYVSLPICPNLCSHRSMCLDLCSLQALCYIPCAWAFHAMFVFLDLGYVCHAMCYCSPFIALSLFIVFWPNGWDLILTLWFVIVRRPNIKGFGSPLFSCLCLLASMLYACVSLSSSRLCHVWHPPWA